LAANREEYIFAFPKKTNMKKIAPYLAALVILFIVNACKKDNSTIKKDPGAAGTATWSATVNGVNINGATTGTYSFSDNSLEGVLDALGDTSIMLNMQKHDNTALTAGNYPFSGNNAYGLGGYFVSNISYLRNVTGSINLLAIDTAAKTANGTFSFHAKNIYNTDDSVVVTNGKFSIINMVVSQ